MLIVGDIDWQLAASNIKGYFNWNFFVIGADKYVRKIELHVFEKSKFEKSLYFDNQRTNGPVNAHLSLLHIPINMFEYYGI